ncbi:MAG: DinB family protein [Lewinella sp.]|nr:DinB family protein [Lewinella sp.]
MPSMTKFPETLPEIQAGMDASMAAAEQLAAEATEPLFHSRPNGKWSIGENLEHLILSNMGVASALARPKAFFEQFGAPQGPSRTYQAMHDQYFVLVQGRTAPPPFAPDREAPTSQADLLHSWRTIRAKYAERLPAHWTEETLDQYCLPHPAIGQLTVREMLFFHIFHNHHHLAAMERIVKGTS